MLAVLKHTSSNFNNFWQQCYGKINKLGHISVTNGWTDKIM